MKKRAIIWFRQDLRLHDNEALMEALRSAEEVIPVYVFDERTFRGKTHFFNFPKTGKYRAQFIIESIHDLRQSLRQIGSDLIVRVGKTEDEIFKIAKEIKSRWVFCNRERTREEVFIQDALENKLWSIGQELRYERGKMLYYTADLPFPVTHTPDFFTNFRKEVERSVPVRQPLPSPKQFNPPSISSITYGNIPTLAELGYANETVKIPFKGGETAALQRLRYYFWEIHALKNYKETRNELLGMDYSSKFSPYLAQGCLSPKTIYHEIKRYEAAFGANESTYWLYFELLWRDFFRLMGKKHGNKIFLKNGILGQSDIRCKNDKHILHLWIEGRTGIPFIDANMREIKQTGFMSNRGRQNVASFLIKDLLINWQMGAEYFESMLIDYDVCSNWGNWNYLAGVGSDIREDRYFNILSQARRYDSEGIYTKHWIPELAKIVAEKIHQPELLTSEELEKYNIRLGVTYPKPMINTKKWL